MPFRITFLFGGGTGYSNGAAATAAFFSRAAFSRAANLGSLIEECSTRYTNGRSPSSLEVPTLTRMDYSPSRICPEECSLPQQDPVEDCQAAHRARLWIKVKLGPGLRQLRCRT